MHTQKTVCLHQNTKAVEMPQGSRHWKALECARCGAHLRFLPWPEHAQQRKVNLRKLVWLFRNATNAQFTLEEDMFLDEVMESAGRLSPKHHEKFDTLCAKHGVPSNASELLERSAR
jgi:hypothetical protein